MTTVVDEKSRNKTTTTERKRNLKKKEEVKKKSSLSTLACLSLRDNHEEKRETRERDDMIADAPDTQAQKAPLFFVDTTNKTFSTVDVAEGGGSTTRAETTTTENRKRESK